MKYDTFYEVGQRVKLETKEFSTDRAKIRAVIFSNAKVRYSIYLMDSQTTLHNVDGIFVVEGYEVDMSNKFDNYS